MTRMRKGMKQKDLAEAAQLPQGLISRVEKGGFTQLDPGKLCQIASALKTTTDFLLLRTDVERVSNHRDGEIYN